jgi:hypothetical protein
MGKHSQTFFSQNLQIFKIGVIYPLDVSLQSTAAQQNYKTYPLIHSFIVAAYFINNFNKKPSPPPKKILLTFLLILLLSSVVGRR